ncbi:hypothetical protein F0562_006456 [Nyssa sinensis]|uniref:Retrovirus-related Pol polyprotein from transposon TNT 1-94-like beta-barrel domain-containing protein n=1 Tax=Nyssa sinensis TaxID=561372 RepID=A0A5J5AR20_9ASTE|nr:hypothetical protein F0562_006456 [Nyssa sinensis]
MAIRKPHAALLASPGKGHLIPVLELGNRLAIHHGFDVTVFAVATDAPPTKSQLHTSPNLFNIIELPPVDISGLVDAGATIFTQIIAMMRQSISNLRSAITAMNSRPTVLIVDLFGTKSLVIADEFEMLKYVYVPSNAWFVAMTLYVPTLDKDLAEGEYVCEKKPLRIPGCKPVRFEDLPDPLQGRKNQMYDDCVRIGVEMLTANGVLVNTWEDLEHTTIGALRDHKILRQAVNVPVHPIGPMIRLAGPSDSRSKLLDWLDMQPTRSVLYVSFGSGGTLSVQQITELAAGLELSQKRFIWVVRPPMEHGGFKYLSASKEGCDGTLDYLPNGFLARTLKVGLVVPVWAPQTEILAHPSVGGYLSHCGWNSTIESIVNGVPLIAWPLYAEQNMNATMLVEAGVAIRSKLLPSTEVVMREEIEKMVRRIMVKDGNEIRARVEKLKDSAEKALSKGGSSYNSLSQVAKEYLKDHFPQVNVSRMYHLEQEIHNLVQDNTSVATYFTKLKLLWDDLASLQSHLFQEDIAQYQQYQHIMKFLMGLNESFGAIHAQILLIDPLPTISHIYGLVLQEECQRNIQTPSPIDGVALAAKGILLTLKDGKKFRTPWPKCTHCHKEGHTIERCYFIHGFPPSSRKPSSGSKPRAHQVSSSNSNSSTSSFPFTLDQCQQLLAMLNTATQSSSMANHVGNIMSSLSGKPPILSAKTLWILDNGATDHMVCYPSDLTYFIHVHSRTVQLLNGSHAVVTHIGSIVFSSSLILKNVLCVPFFLNAS